MSKARSAARLAAVQALYQMDMENIGLARLLDEFHANYLFAISISSSRTRAASAEPAMAFITAPIT